jgi:RNA polymerase sporulation-specific sigma factor
MNVLGENADDPAMKGTGIGELVWQSQMGEARALEELLRIYEKLILRISKRYYFQDGEMDDVIQECKIAFWQSVMNYNNLENSISLESFAYICINRRMASALRKRTKKGTTIHTDAMTRKALPSKDVYSLEIDLPDFKGDIERDFIFEELKKEYLNKFNTEISRESGEILQLREEGYSYKEIGEKLNISTKKVDNTIYKIRKKIKSEDILEQ